MTLMVGPAAHVDIRKLRSRFPSKSGILGVAHHTVSFVLDKFRMLSQLCALGNLWANIGKFPGFCGLGLSLQRK
jgi:hypothetical protein